MDAEKISQVLSQVLGAVLQRNEGNRLSLELMQGIHIAIMNSLKEALKNASGDIQSNE